MTQPPSSLLSLMAIQATIAFRQVLQAPVGTSFPIAPLPLSHAPFTLVLQTARALQHKHSSRMQTGSVVEAPIAVIGVL